MAEEKTEGRAEPVMILYPKKPEIEKPCPFCGSSDTRVNRGKWVECNNCRCFGPSGDTIEEAVILWNMRSPS